MEEMINRLMQLIEERDANTQEYNMSIAELVAPTFLSAVVHVLNVDQDHIEWVDANVVNSSFVIVINVTYDPKSNSSQFLQDPDQEDEILSQKMLRIGVPLDRIFGEVDSIVDYLLSISTPEEKEKSFRLTPALYQFDEDCLTDNQRQQLHYFQGYSGETKQ